MANRRLNCVAISCLLSMLQLTASALSRYEVEVTISNYSNPRQARPSCDERYCYRNPFFCCDGDSNECPEDTVDSRCDSFFIYCLNRLETPPRSLGCQSGGEMTSAVNRNDGPLNFSQSTLLGLDNPFILQGLTENWTGVQLHVIIFDQDPMNVSQIVDGIAFNITQPAQIPSGKQTLTGVLGFVTMEVDITILCTSGYTGALCNETDNCVNMTCSGHGRCVNGVDTYKCNCSEGYTGSLCEINVDDCMSNPCGKGGQCIDGVNGFNCTCYEGFTGEKCEINIDDCEGVNCSGNGECLDGVNSFTCECRPGHSGPLCAEVQSVLQHNTNVGIVVGGALGGCVILVVVIAVVIVITVQRSKDKLGLGRTTNSKHTTLPGDNPVYDLGSGYVTASVPLRSPNSQTQVKYMNVTSQTERGRSESVPDHEFENPIYGGNEGEDVYSDSDTQRNGIGMGFSPYRKFDNPIYGDDNNDSTNYSGIYETSTQMYQRSRVNGHDDGVTLTGDELVYDLVT